MIKELWFIVMLPKKIGALSTQHLVTISFKVIAYYLLFYKYLSKNLMAYWHNF